MIFNVKYYDFQSGLGEVESVAIKIGKLLYFSFKLFILYNKISSFVHEIQKYHYHSWYKRIKSLKCENVGIFGSLLVQISSNKSGKNPSVSSLNIFEYQSNLFKKMVAKLLNLTDYCSVQMLTLNCTKESNSTCRKPYSFLYWNWKCNPWSW